MQSICMELLGIVCLKNIYQYKTISVEILNTKSKSDNQNIKNSIRIFLRVNRIKTDHRHTINSNGAIAAAAKYLLNDDK